MKKRKLSTGELQVTSFITSLPENHAATLKGGNPADTVFHCDNTYHSRCYPTLPLKDCLRYTQEGCTPMA